MYAYQGNNIDDVMVPGRFPGLFTDNEHVFAWEDLLGGGDKDYADFVVIVESVTAEYNFREYSTA